MDDIIVIVILILLNGVFSMSEIAMISARKSRLESDARKGGKGPALARKLASDPDRFLSTIQIGITLIGILTGLYSGAALADSVGDILHGWGLPARTAHVVGQVAIVVVVTYLSIVVGELVPKRIGLAAANVVAKLVSRPMNILSLAAMPFVWLLSKSTSLLVRLLNISQEGNSVTEDEIKSLIQDGTDSGEVKKVEQDIMERVLVLGDLRVSSIMTPKVDVVCLNLDMDVDDIKQVLSEELYSSYPVYCRESKEDVCGVVSLKQLILSIDRLGSGCEGIGGLAGVVTPGDILEGLVGEMSAQGVSRSILPDDSGKRWCVDAQMSFYDFLHHFNLEDLYEPASYSTLSGFLLEELKYFPSVGDRLSWHNIDFEVESIEGAKIKKLLIEVH